MVDLEGVFSNFIEYVLLQKRRSAACERATRFDALLAPKVDRDDVGLWSELCLFQNQIWFVGSGTRHGSKSSMDDLGSSHGLFRTYGYCLPGAAQV